MNKVIDKGFRSCRFVSTIVKHPVFTMELFANGALCAPQTVSRSAKPPGSLVSGPHTNYQKAKEHYNNHQNCHYHKLCAATFDNFVQTDANKSRDVRNALKQQSTEGCRGKSKSSALVYIKFVKGIISLKLKI